jgi:uncharacterized protein (DUF2147 family)
MRFARIAIVTGATFVAAAAHADNSPLGVWIDHTGRGAVEITDCNGKLCGHVAWVDDAKNSDQCGKQIIGNVKSVGKNKWDNGWIFDPDRGSKYDVELTALKDDKLKVMGYAGTKWLSETYTWKRAPADLKKCNGSGDSAAATPAAPAEEKTDTAKADTSAPAAKPATETKSDAIELNTAKSESDDADNGKSDKAKAKPDKPAASETAKTEPAKPEAKDNADTAKADTDDDANDEPKGKKGGKVIARLMEELESGDGPIKVKRNGKTCKITAPYVGVISIPCDGDKD